MRWYNIRKRKKNRVQTHRLVRGEKVHREREREREREPCSVLDTASRGGKKSDLKDSRGLILKIHI